MQGRWDEAKEAYEDARKQVKDLRGRVDTEDLRISILKDKLAVYESLVSLSLESNKADSVDRALMLVQEAKSRSLADRLGAQFALQDRPGEDGDHLEELRRDLNWVYRQIEASDLPGGALRSRARDLETQYLEATSRIEEQGACAPSLDAAPLLRSLEEGEVLLEYYEARGTLYCFLLSRHSVRAVRLGAFLPIRQLLKLVQFQLGKFRSKPERAGGSIAVSDHFRELYQLLIAPLEEGLALCTHLVVAPHRMLHGLPFAALHNGENPLIERFTVSLAPSARVFAQCRAAQRASGGEVIVMGVPDRFLPRIEEEARVVAQALPGSRLLLGEAACYAAFCALAPEARILHLATHGIFRPDNPMFSALQLSDSRLSRLDLNRMDLKMELLTLSACHTGSAVAVGGDELLGLVRGFLLAGARSLLVTLWEIDDAAAKDFMRSFYREVGQGERLAGALRTAILELREHYPHPYYWAPFLLVGDPSALG